MSAPPPLCQTGVAWLVHAYGRDCLVALTGQDSAALAASLHVLDLYARGDAPGKRSTVIALRALVAAMQPHARERVRWAIEFVLDKQAQARLWPRLSVSVGDAIHSARALIKLALNEENDAIERQKISEIGAKLIGMADAEAGELLPLVRRIVTDLRTCALPGGELEDAAKAWLARRENGGTA